MNSDMQKKVFANWNIGQLCSLFSGALVGFEFQSVALGVLCFFALGLLVDIRALLSD